MPASLHPFGRVQIQPYHRQQQHSGLEYFSISTIYLLFNGFVASEAIANLDWYTTYLANYLVPIPTPKVWA